ncbi:MAG: nucleotide sugar dehydrogenase, partial [Acidimicrobiales bacterium]|nr:nucleotide sugar dehydrogenase [Acidimicrobiales bacterium]
LGRDDLAVVSNPEFLREGSAVRDFLEPDRVVVGADDPSAAEAVAALYDGFNSPVLVTDPVSAETIKYAANAFLVTKLSFVNSIAAVCESVGADVDDVMTGLGHDRRIGSGYLRPGPGWGGSCFPKDTRSLLQMAGRAGYDFRFLDVAVAVNEEQFDRVADKVRKAAGGDLAGRTVAAWGLTFKAGTDDLRDSPALAVIDRLLTAGATVRAHDPTVAAARPPIPDDVVVVSDLMAACDGADVLVVLTEWDNFQAADPAAVADRLVRPAVVDARNLLDRALWEGHGFEYQGIGR